MNHTYNLILYENQKNELNTVFNKNNVNSLIILIVALLVIYIFLFCIKYIIIYKKQPYPFIKIDNITDEDNNLFCPICLEELNDHMRKFKNCSHILHDDCAKTFLLNYIKKCPICRKYIYMDN